MDCTKQPPRRPSNKGIAGIVGLARMTDKARAFNGKNLGEYLYGEDSGLDAEVLEFINIIGSEYAEAAAKMNDVKLSSLALEKAQKSAAEIEAFNKKKLEQEPQDERHIQMRKERIAKYAPERTDIKTVFQSMELDDWGGFREKDLTVEPPRCPYMRSVAGIVAVARMADKARAAKAGLLGEYNYGADSPLDSITLKFLDVSADEFSQAAYQNPNDIELGEWLQENTNRSNAEISAFNARRINAGRSGDYRKYLLSWRDEICPERTDLDTFFDLMDYDDERCFGLVDLTRHAPRSPYDTSVGGLTALGRMIDKAQAYNSNTLGDYYYGEDCLVDSSLLEFLSSNPDEFAEALKEHTTDEAVVEWLGKCLQKQAVEKFNQKMWQLGPENEEQQALLNGVISSSDASRSELETFFAIMVLDDTVSFARLKTGV